MLSLRVYYLLKPYTPWRLRMSLRRVLAKRTLQASRAHWPILETAAEAPEGWPGWPDGKRFAFVLTHDVEGPAGLEKCRALAELEMEMGVRSTFNFVPEGQYQVPASLREWLVENGFEVGVHDLRHDGRLFGSQAKFSRNAERINHYLKDWKATGFRAGFMLRKLDWLHQLDVRYDASTFDTDPFEFQSDGAGSIFPFWIPSPSSPDDLTSPPADRKNGYIELPYTLPQDSTLFLLLQQTSPEVWLRKLDWIAKHGGMALVNVHPDYLQFDGEKPSSKTYSVAHYRALLEHVRMRYGRDHWQATAGELADYVRPFKPALKPRKKKVCMITHSFYESDNRVIRYAASLAARGDHVDVVALRRSESLPAFEKIDGVNLHRLVRRTGRQERSKLGYFLSWAKLLLTSTWWAARQHRRKRYDLFHIHNMPDFLVAAAWYPRLAGAKVILDIHDITPEFYRSKFGISQRTFASRILEWTERASARMADHVIISNHLWREKYAERTDTARRCSVFINNVDSHVFLPRPRTEESDQRIIIFPGGLQWHQGIDIALTAFKQVSSKVAGVEFHIYGDGNQKPALIELSRKLELDDKVRFFDPVSIKEIARIMAGADIGVVPKRADSFGNEAYSTKIMEFMSVGVPVVISSTRIDRFYFNDKMARFFASGDPEALAAGLLEVLTNDGVRESLIRNASLYAAANAWSSREPAYLRIVDNLIMFSAAECETELPTIVEEEPAQSELLT